MNKKTEDATKRQLTQERTTPTTINGHHDNDDDEDDGDHHHINRRNDDENIATKASHDENAEADKSKVACDYFTKHFGPNTLSIRSLSELLGNPFDWRSVRILALWVMGLRHLSFKVQRR